MLRGGLDPYGLSWLDYVQGGLDVVGFVPGIGTVADIANAGVSLYRGDKTGAMINLVAACPGIGDSVKLAHVANKAYKAGGALNSVRKGAGAVGDMVKRDANAAADLVKGKVLTGVPPNKKMLEAAGGVHMARLGGDTGDTARQVEQATSPTSPQPTATQPPPPAAHQAPQPAPRVWPDPQPQLPRVSSDLVNQKYIDADQRPPYTPGTMIETLRAYENMRLVRVHGPDNCSGRWLMHENDIIGLSPQQIRDKYALPETPSLVSDVAVPVGTPMNRGEAGGLDGWGGGGGTQYELTEQIPRDSFGNTRPLGDVYEP